MTRAWPISWMLYLLVVATAAPLCAYIAHSLVREAREAHRQAEQLVLSLATSAAVTVRSRLTEVETLAATLARRPLVRLLDPQSCDPLLAGMLQLMPRFTNISVVGPDGRFVCSAVPVSVDQPPVPMHAGLRGALNGRFAVSEAMMGVLPRRLVVSAAYPITSGSGAIVGAVTIPVDLASFQPAFDPVGLPEGARVRVIDASGVLIASSTPRDPELGTSVRGAEIVERALASGVGAGRAKGTDGIERIYGHAEVGVHGWRTYAGVPVTTLLADARERTLQSAAVAAALLAVALVSAGLLARAIARPASAMYEAINAAAAGRLRYAESAGPLELRALAANYNRMLDANARAHAALNESEQRLQLAVRASNVGLWDWDVVSDRVYFSPEWKRQLGYEEHEIGDRVEEWASRLHPDERDRELALQRFVAARGQSQYESEFRLRHKDGSYRWIHSRAELIRDSDGAPRRMVGTHIDITARKALEHELQQTVSDLRVLSLRLMEAGEAERRRIGRELHDRTGSHLSVLGITLRLGSEKLDEGDIEGARELLHDAREILRECSADIRGVIAELRPATLDDFGLGPALENYAEAVANRIGAALSLSGTGAQARAPAVIETALFRIAQEALTNIAKHAGATKVTLALEQRAGEIVLEIADDGAGFDTSAARGYGMRTMRERADAVGAALEVVSAPGGGTRVTVRAPLA